MKKLTVLFPLLMLFPILLSACCSKSKQTIQCIGYPQKVCDRCGENPVEVVLQKRLYATNLPESVKTSISSCVTGSIGLDIKSDPIAKANLDACLKKAISLDEKTQAELIKIVDDALNNEHILKLKETWDKCYNDIVTSKQKVVLMDSPLEGVVYNKSTRDSGGTNADEITDALKDLPIAIYKETTSLLWHREQQVFDLDPDLIIIHLSCFYSETNVNDSDKKFRKFLEYMKPSHSKFLVYTRGLAPNAANETKARWEELKKFLLSEEWKDRLVLHEFRRDDTINFYDSAFKAEVKDLLKI